MSNPTAGDDLIDLVVRLPRATVVESIKDARHREHRSQSERLTIAKAILASRRRRNERFVGVHFSDPAWDMILELYVAAAENRQLRVSKLCSLAGTPKTTAFRHLEDLELRGFLVRVDDPGDGRSTLAVMQPALERAMNEWLEGFVAEVG